MTFGVSIGDMARNQRLKRRMAPAGARWEGLSSAAPSFFDAVAVLAWCKSHPMRDRRSRLMSFGRDQIDVRTPDRVQRLKHRARHSGQSRNTRNILKLAVSECALNCG